jgi:hypothetical protein
MFQRYQMVYHIYYIDILLGPGLFPEDEAAVSGTINNM